ncbi:DUF1566 domain-containing protein [uncultured Thiodictyon sp.]|uniref:Lcl C-terminal domain-containing protein n=1 Tax=uncultured Thiodictyon sp. TaxID=1846217 RepID=UPI0025D76C16|nr:DUF1566 domain-containing protein [uncultured Thiodictyon sp.]
MPTIGRVHAHLQHGLLPLLLCAAATAQAAQAARLDADGDGVVAPATDGTLILRHLFGFSGTALTAGALGAGATRDAEAITAYLDRTGALWDVDGDGRVDALTDGVLIMRYLLGRTGSALTVGAVAAGATRTTPGQIAPYLAALGQLPVLDLNDTGITSCGNAISNGLPCPVAGFPGQDAEHGRDATNNDDSDGHAGFSFTKLDANGNPLAASEPNWTCVRDNVTGLIWEVKTADGGWRDQNNTYSWYNPDPATNGGSAGSLNLGVCTGGISCDTDGYVRAVNAQGLCGAADWRIPNPRELLSIVSNDRISPTIDLLYFPNTLADSYVWSLSPNAHYADYAWNLRFNYGNADFSLKLAAVHIRLVRAGQ